MTRHPARWVLPLPAARSLGTAATGERAAIWILEVDGERLLEAE